MQNIFKYIAVALATDVSGPWPIQLHWRASLHPKQKICRLHRTLSNCYAASLSDLSW